MSTIKRWTVRRGLLKLVSVATRRVGITVDVHEVQFDPRRWELFWKHPQIIVSRVPAVPEPEAQS